jgi:exonuclease SbcD
MKLLHTSDIHVTEGPRLDDQCGVLDAIVRSAVSGDVDLSIVAGDLAGTAVPHVATVIERAVLCHFFQRLANLGPVIVPRGNHDDAGDIEVYGRLAGKFPIVVATQPEHFTVPTRSGEAEVFMLPWVTTAHVGAILGAAGMPTGVEMVRGEAIRLFAQFVRLWIDAEPRQPGVPRILAGHVAIGGARLAGGEVLLGHDIELPGAMFETLDLDYVGLGHIHLEQSVSARAYYSGSPSPHSFGEPDPKGWNLIRLGPACPGGTPLPEGDMTIVRVPSPAAPIVTMHATWDTVADAWILDKPLDDYLAGLAGAEVRVVTSVPEALVDTVDVARLERDVLAHGAGRVVVQRRLVASERVRSAAMAAATTVEEQVAATLDTFVPPVEDDQRARVLALVREVGAACGFIR